MAFISFSKESEFDISEDKKKLDSKIIEPGTYTAEIAEAANIISKFDSEEVFIIKLKMIDKNLEISKRFKLWNSNVKTRIKAQQDLINLLKMLNVNIFAGDTSNDFDTDALIGKTIGIVVKQTKDTKDRTYSFIDSFYLLSSDSQKKSLVEDTIGF